MDIYSPSNKKDYFKVKLGEDYEFIRKKKRVFS